MVVASGWWVAIVQLTPAADRPYIGGSQDNSLLNLIFGYNGLGRLTGNESGSVGGTGTAGSMWGPTGLDRLFNTSFGGQISWLLPAALILLIAGLGFTLTRTRTDRTRAAFLLWGGSLAVTALVFSLAAGIIHPYYTVALAPPIGALVGIGSVLLWRERSRTWARLVLAGAVAATSIWSAILLERSPGFAPGLAAAVATLGIGAAIAIVGMPLLHRAVVAVVVAVGLAAAFAGPAAYTIDTVLTAHSGAIPSAGPAVTAAVSGGGPGWLHRPRWRCRDSGGRSSARWLRRRRLSGSIRRRVRHPGRHRRRWLRTRWRIVPQRERAGCGARQAARNQRRQLQLGCCHHRR